MTETYHHSITRCSNGEQCVCPTVAVLSRYNPGWVCHACVIAERQRSRVRRMLHKAGYQRAKVLVQLRTNDLL